MNVKNRRFRLTPRAVFTLGAFLFVAILLWISADYPPRARYVPQVVAVFALVCLGMQLALDAFPVLEELYRRVEKQDVFSVDEGVRAARSGNGAELGLELIAYFWLFILLGGLLLFGFLLAIPTYIALYLRFQARLSWLRSAIYGAGTWLFVYGLFVRLFEIPLYSGLLINWLLDL